MNKCFTLLFLLLLMNFCHQAISDEVTQKTDGSFVGNDSFSGEDTHQQTDNTFVGTDIAQEGNSFFAGRDFDQQVKEGTDAPFAGDKPVDSDSYGK